VKLYVGITDYDWFRLHSSKPFVEEVNFWKPSSQLGFKVLQWGEPFLFKLKSPRNYIVGGGFFTKFLRLPMSLAWDTFGEANGATSLHDFRMLVSKHRENAIGPTEDPVIGCTLLEEPFFFEQADWIPFNFAPGIQSGKSFEMQSGVGLTVWQEVTERLERAQIKNVGPATVAAQESARYGPPRLVAPRLGQGSFRLLVTDAYRYRCAITSERTLPVLQAAHIRPYSVGGKHELSNGLLLRSDLHTLFDLGYMTVEPNQKTLIVSRRIREQFENGRAYYDLKDTRLADPDNQLAVPSFENLKYHFDQFCQREGQPISSS
jgi:putative restriction endonuclease